MAEYNYPGDGPGNAPRSRHVAPVAAAATLLWHVVAACLPSMPASAKESRVSGCWDRELTDPSRDNRVNLCFDPDGKFSGIYLEPTGEASDFTGVWRLRGSRLTIARELCVIELEASGHRFTLSHCSHEGAWHRCGDLDNFEGCLKR
jgi:hypothetical protein